MAEKSAWHLEKSFSIGIIGAICLQCACFVWYGAKLDSQVEATKTDVAALQVWKDKQDDDRAKINASLATVSQKLTDQGDLIRRIDDILESGIKRKFQ